MSSNSKKSAIYTVQANDFVLSKKAIPLVFSLSSDPGNVKLQNRDYSELFKEFSNQVIGVYAVEGKEERIKNVINIRFQCAYPNCAKRYRITCKKSEIDIEKDLIWKVETNESVCDHTGETPRPRNVSGSKRVAIKNKLKYKTTRELYKEMVENDDVEKIQRGVTDVVNKNVIAKIHQEVLKENDLHHDVMIDLMIKAENESFKFIDLSVAPVRCKLVSQLQLKTAIDFFKNKNCLRRCHFDATGSILGKISSDRPEMMLYYLILPLKTNEKNTNHLRFNIAELVSESQTSFTIESFLRHVANDVKMLSSSNFQLIHEVVVDWSWAEINAVIKAFNNISVQNYIDTVFKIISTGDPLRLKSLVVLLECSSHLTHTMKSDVKKHVKDFVQQKLICMLLGQIFNCESWVQACSVIEDLIAVLTSKTKNCRVELAIVRIQNNDVLSADENIDNNEQEAIEFEKRDCKEIYKDSAFFQFFSEKVEKFIHCDDGPLNEAFNPDLLHILLKKYIAFLPFWTKILTVMRFPKSNPVRANNGYVESYIGDLKTDIKEQKLKLGKFGTIRLGRYVDYQRVRMEIHVKQIKACYAQTRDKRAMKRGSELMHEELDSQNENWKNKGKPKKSRRSLFFD